MTKNTSNSRLGEAESGDFGISGAEKAHAPVFRFGLFTREKARAHDGTLMIISRCCHCAARYEHPKHANTTTLKTHSRVKHKDILSDLAKKAQHDIKTNFADYADTILNTDLLQGSHQKYHWVARGRLKGPFRTRDATVLFNGLYRR